MKRIIRFVPLLLLMYVNLYAGHTTGTAPTVLAANFTAPVTTGCAPLAVSFTSTSTINAGDPIVNYNWNFGDGVTLSSTNATPSHTYSTAGTFTVTLTVTSQGGSTNTIVKTGFVTTFSKPVFSLGPDLTICNATQILLTSVSGYDTYIWNIPGANTFPNYFVTPPVGVNTYWVEVGNGTCTTRDSIVVTVTNALIGKFGYNVVSSCGNVQVQFTDSSSSCNPAKPITYIGWLFDGEYDVGNDVTYTFATGGTHNVTYLIMNDYGDQVQIDSVITLPNPTPGPSPVNMGPAKNICLGNSVQLDAGNEPGVTYAWTPATGLNSTTIYNPVASPASNITYNVTKSKCGVNESGSITVNVNPPLTVDLGPDQTMCPGGSLLLDAGVTGATYQWGSTYNPIAYLGETGQTTFALGAGQYWVSVTKNGCTVRDTIQITLKPAVDPHFTYTQTGFCSTLSVGFTDASIPCSGSIVTYEWNFGDGSPVVSGGSPTVSHNYASGGTYTVSLKVTTSTAFSSTYSESITVTGGGLSVDLGPDAAICSGSNITLDAGDHGTGTTYSWSPGGATTRTITVSTAGTYTVTVTKSGCSGTDAKVITVTAPPVVNLGPDAAICAGSNITLDAGDHGTGTTYSWSPGGATTRTITVSTAGTYTVTVTRNGCSGTDAKIITLTTPPTVNLGPDAAICAGSNITLDAGDHGTGTTYSWSPGGATTRTITVSTAGTYTVTVTRNGCSGTDAKIITLTTPPTVNLGPDAAICAGSNITLDAGDHGTGTTYSWSPGGATTRTITVSTAGTYTVTVTRNGCSGTDAKIITLTTPPTVNLGPDAAICAGSNITLDAGDHGTGTTYSWSPGGATTRTITVSTAGTYTVTVTRNGCSGTDAKVITVTAPPVVNLGPDAAICAGSNITLDAGDHGTGTTYSWSPGGATTRTITVSTAGTYTVTVTRNGCSGTDAKIITLTTPPTVNLGPDAAICAGSNITLDAGDHGTGTTYSWSPGGATTRTITVSTAGTYTVTVTRNGCSGTDAKIITLTTPPTVNLGPDAAICAGSNITLDAGDHGTGTTYSWSPGGATTRTITVSTAGTYTVTVTRNGCSGTDAKIITLTTPPTVNLGPDAAICAGSNITLDAGDHGTGTTYSWSPGGATTRTITVSTAGTYTVTVTRNGCSGTDAKIITLTTPPTVNLGPDAAICAGSNITLDAGDHGTGTTYSWSPGGATTRTITVSTAGTYTVTVTRNGCSGTDAKVITVTAPPVVNLGPDAAICAGSNITLDAGDHGTGTTYSWSPGGATTRTITVSTAGTYTVTVTRNGCSGTDAKIITLTTPPTVNLGPDAAICAGSNITLDAGDHGTGTTYSWSPGGATTRTITVSTAGTYTVTVTRNGCSGTDAKIITLTTPPTVNLGPDAAICAGSNITLDAGDHGTGTTYSWSPGGATTRTITVSTAGTYTVIVTRNGCSGTDAKVITVTAPPVVNLGPDAAICAGSNITLDAGDHGTGTTYSWSPGGATTRTITVSTAGTYTVTVTRNGCSGTDAKVITVTAPPVVNLGPDAAICAGSNITLDAGDHGTGTTYSWSPGGATTRTITVSTAGTYTVTVTRNGCSGTDAKIITLTAPGFTVDLGPDQAMCPGGQIILDAGVTGATYQWGSTYLPFVYAGETGKTTVALGVGKYWVSVSQGGCTVTDTILITAKPAVEAKFNYTLTGACSPILASFEDASVQCSGSIMERTWNFGDGSPILSGNNLAPTHNYTQPGTYHVTLSVKTSAGVTNTYEEDVLVSGTAIPVNLGNDTTICAGSSIVLDAGSHPGASYEWAPGGATTQTITVNTTDTYIVTITKDGCKAIDAINVTVAPELTVNLGNDTTICAGASVILDAGNPGATYLWSTGETTRTIVADHINTYSVTVDNGSCTGGGSIKVDISSTLPVSLGNDTTICAGSSITLNAGYPGALYTWSTGEVSQTLTVDTAGIYNVTVNKDGCIGNAEIEITQAYAPSVVNLGSDSTICFGYGIVLDAGNVGASYLWSTGETTQTITAASSGAYSVSVTGCGKTVSDEINLNIVNLPAPTITQVGIELVASEADTYQWYKNGVSIPGATDRKYKPRGYGTYKVAVTSTASACTGESSGYFFVPNGDIYLGAIRIKLSPNPGNGLAKLVFSKLPPKPVNVTVYDRVGRRILHTTMMNTVNDINLTAYAKGEYFVECILGDDRIIIPLITQ